MRTATTTLHTDADVEALVEERSHERLVLAAFVGGADEPPVPDLEGLCIDRGGCFELVLVDVARAPATARRCRVIGTPAICAFRDGVLIERFEGDAAVGGLRAWLEIQMPREAARAADAAERAGPGDPAAMLAYAQALACDPSCAQALLGLARLYAHQGDAATALALATRVRSETPEADDAARLADELRRRVDPVGEEAMLRARAAMDLEDVDTRIALVRSLWRRAS